MAYSDKVVDHYNNPRNVGSFDKSRDDVGTGMVGAPECGDIGAMAGRNRGGSVKSGAESGRPGFPASDRDRAADCAENLIRYLPAIYEWHLRPYVAMMIGEETGPP